MTQSTHILRPQQKIGLVVMPLIGIVILAFASVMLRANGTNLKPGKRLAQIAIYTLLGIVLWVLIFSLTQFT